MTKAKFKQNETYLPVTLEQWTDLVNEFLGEFNKIAAPKFLVAGAMEELLMQAIHHLDHDKGIVSKAALFEGCINRLSCHMTYESVRASQAAAKAAAEPQGATTDPEASNLAELPDEPA